MLIVGCDYHPGFQQIAFVDTETGELQERRLAHREEAEKFYRELGASGVQLRVGMEASGHARWFERLLAELHFELWMGDAAAIRAKRVRKQRTDRQDAQHMLNLLLENRFPRIWVASWENRDLRQLLWHRQRMVQMRTRIMNGSTEPDHRGAKPGDRTRSGEVPGSVVLDDPSGSGCADCPGLRADHRRR